MYYLYRKAWCTEIQSYDGNAFLKECRVERFVPTLFRLKYTDEQLNLKTRLGRLYFWLITKGRFVIYYLWKGNSIVHTAYVVPKCFKFPFLYAQDYEIGPCITNEQFRRKGSYRFMLEHITADEINRMSNFYMIVSDSNLASIAGIEKAGFQRYGTVEKNTWLNYTKVENS